MARTDWEAKLREMEYLDTSVFKKVFTGTAKKYIAANALLAAIKIAGKVMKK